MLMEEDEGEKSEKSLKIEEYEEEPQEINI